MDRFELEDKITAMHSTVEELNVLARMILEQDIDKDDITNTIYGIKMLHEGRINELFDTFTQVFKLDQYSELNKEEFNDIWSKYSYSENTNPSVDVDFNNIKSCCKRNCNQ
jgi:hypothetical protein